MSKLLKSGAGKVTGLIDDFKAFILRGNVLDLAVGIIIGTAFNAIIKSMVADILMPLVSLAGPGNVLEETFLVLRWGERPANNDTYDTRQEAKDMGAITMNYGFFFQTIINFLIVALCLFVIIKLVYIMHHKEEAVSTDWPCPKCKEMVKEGATRCSHCAAEPIQPDAKEETEIPKEP